MLHILPLQELTRLSKVRLLYTAPDFLRAVFRHGTAVSHMCATFFLFCSLGAVQLAAIDYLVVCKAPRLLSGKRAAFLFFLAQVEISSLDAMQLAAMELW